MSINVGNFHWEAYRYTPSLVGCGIGLTTFTILAGLHGFRLQRSKLWYLAPITIGSCMEVVGYISRIFSSFNTSSWPPAVIQNLMILVAPLLFAASIYMMLGRTIRAFEMERFSIVPPKMLTKVFVGGDIFSFLVQSIGTIVLACGFVNPINATIGPYIIIAGIASQCLSFLLFIITSSIFHSNVRRSHRSDKIPLSSTLTGKILDRDTMKAMDRILLSLYTLSVFILVRSVFRLVEYVQGNDGYLTSHEIFLYIFDTLLMASTLILLLVLRPETAITNQLKNRSPVELVENVDEGRSIEQKSAL